MKWLRLDAVLAIHQRQAEQHRTSPGLRSLDLLESALARARNKSAYGRADVFVCAAAYGFAIARNHPFVDGNKRMALLAMYVFLWINGYMLDVSETDAYTTIMALAAGNLTETKLAAWVKANAKRIRKR
ncbi:MAG TPA: type II toxin-antitoxin system death-on-curing family toxin [Magnetospirillaceae bacterium]|jgi:death-on-curing protein